MAAVETPAVGTAAYRAVLRLPGVTGLSAFAFLARIPAAAAAITLTLHVVLTLGEGYAAAGAVGAAATVGKAVGAPLLGRLIDRRGLRTVLAIAVCAEAAFWTFAPSLPYGPLLLGALLGGMFGLPVYSVVRQSLAAMVPAAQRRPAFALDAMSVELSYIIGPAAATVTSLQLGTGVALWAVGACLVGSGVALWLLNPPTRAPSTGAEPAAEARLREWLDLRLVGALLATTAAVFLLFGTELSVIAALQARDQIGTIPVVNAVWCLASLAGGFVYGAARRSASLFVLVGVLGVVTLPLAFGVSWWSYALLLVPAGLLCAPALAASSEAVSALAPEHARGLVTGLHGSAITLGAAAGTPLAGLLIDVASPAVAVLTIGVVGISAAGLAALVSRSSRSGTGVERPPSAASQPT